MAGFQAVLYFVVKVLVFRSVWDFRRRIAEGSPKGRREGILADINARPPDEREPGNCRDRIATHSGGGGAGEKKKKKPPKKKAPNKKRETAACGSACLRAAAPPSSLASFLSSFGGCAASFSCPLRASLSSCGRLRRPSSLLLLRFSSAFFGGCAASLSSALSWAAGAAPSPPSPTL